MIGGGVRAMSHWQSMSWISVVCTRCTKISTNPLDDWDCGSRLWPSGQEYPADGPVGRAVIITHAAWHGLDAIDCADSNSIRLFNYRNPHRVQMKTVVEPAIQRAVSEHVHEQQDSAHANDAADYDSVPAPARLDHRQEITDTRH